jgi:pyruvate/2-oxoglutarate dehydrogenase complex dihydrolipoamide dehydrogenase (E3) component
LLAFEDYWYTLEQFAGGGFGWTGKASFLNDHDLLVKMMDGSERTVKAERIFINTGATPIVPSIEGLALGKRVVTSKEIMSLDRRPDRLVIIGAGYIGLEYASMFANFGSEVTVIDGRAEFIPREDEDIAAMVYEDMSNQGIKFELGQKLVKVVENQATVEIHYGNNETKVIEADMVLVATGRKPNTD